MEKASRTAVNIEFDPVMCEKVQSRELKQRAVTPDSSSCELGLSAVTESARRGQLCTSI